MAYAALLVALGLVLLLNQRGLFTPDIKPEVYLNPLRRLGLDLGTWLPDPYLGTTNYNMGLAPVDALTSLLAQAGVPAELMVRLLRLVLYASAGWGAVRLYRTIAGAADVAIGRITMAVVMVANPYAVVGGATLAVLLPYAIFPWLCWALVRALRAGRGWRWPAAGALFFALSSGMNVGAVPLLQLVALPAIVIYVRRVDRTPWWRLLLTVARFGLLSVLVSLYWLVPAALSAGAGQVVVDNSETLAGIAAPSSWAEVLRGLGLWPMYGGDQGGPWQPGFVPYLQDPLVILATFALPVLAAAGALLSRSRVRLVAVLLLATVGAVMVGLHPPASPSPFGDLLRWVFENVPGMVALRTTNKAGAGLALAIALLVALAAVELARRLPTHAARAAAGVAVLAVLAGCVQPALAGQLYVGRWDVPDYWRQAATAMDGEGTAQRTWFVPGQVLAAYRWATQSVDDVNLSLLDHRPSLVRTVLPTESAETTNLLAAVDTQLQEGTLPPSGTSVFARYLGAGDVLLRNDVVWENFAGGRPAVIQPLLVGDPGLVPAGVWGARGENVRSPTSEAGLVDLYESRSAPLHRFRVEDPRDLVRAETAADTVVIAGDGWAVTPLATAGLLPGQPAFRYAGSLDPDSFAALLGGRHRLVLTDTNRRTTVSSTVLTDAYGPLLTAAQDPGNTRALYTAADQTVAEWAGGVSDVTATSWGTPFSRGIAGNPTLAVDGDAGTAWLFGAFGSAVGESLTVHLDRTRSVHRVQVLVAPAAGGVRVSQVEVTAGAESRVGIIDADERATVDFDGVPADRVTVHVTGVDGEGINLVGIQEVTIDGVSPRRFARLPDTLTRLAAGLDADSRVALTRTPLDVVMSRAATHRPGRTDEEAALLRRFSLPDLREYRAYGVARPDSRPLGGSYAPGSDGCYPLLSVDGRSLAVRPVDPKAPARGGPWLFQSCGRALLGAGQHVVTTRAPWTADVLVLRDRRGEDAWPGVQSGQVEVTEQTATRLAATVTTDEDSWFLAGTSADPRWRATLDGEPLGDPVVVDGNAMAWPVPAGTHDVVVTFEPQAVAETARVASVAGLALVILLLVFPRRWLPRRRRSTGADQPAADRSAPAQSPPLADRSGPTRVPGPARRGLEGVLIAGLVAFVGGWPLAVVGLVLGVTHAWLLPAARTWLRLALAAAALVGPAWLVATVGDWGLVSPGLVLDHPLPGYLAATAVALLVLGVVTDDRGRSGPGRRHAGGAAAG